MPSSRATRKHNRAELIAHFMPTVAHIATYPPRLPSLMRTLECVYPQVDGISLILNEYDAIPAGLSRFDRIDCVIPALDLKDTGKFYPSAAWDDDILLCDDDLLYPPDYVIRLKEAYARYAHLTPVVGVHGVIYPATYDGTIPTRHTVPLGGSWNSNTAVHLLGTGTMLLKGSQMPPFELMRSAQLHVDLAFAHYAHQARYPLVCIARQAGWLKETPHDSTIFHDFTMRWPEPLRASSLELKAYPLLDLRSY